MNAQVKQEGGGALRNRVADVEQAVRWYMDQLISNGIRPETRRAYEKEVPAIICGAYTRGEKYRLPMAECADRWNTYAEPRRLPVLSFPEMLGRTRKT